jgi:hypothetical protein
MNRIFHWYFRSHPDFALAVNRGRARELFSQSGKVLAAFHGHMHWNHTSIIDGVTYVTMGALSCCGLTGGPPAGCFSEVVVEETGQMSIGMHGVLRVPFME